MIDLVSIANNCDIISGLIKKFKISSLNKIIFYTFYISIGEHLIVSNNKKNGVEKDFFELIGLNLLNNQNKINNIFSALKLLELSNAIKIESNFIKEEKNLRYSCKNKILDSKLFSVIMDKTQNLTEESFLLEVIKNV